MDICTLDVFAVRVQESITIKTKSGRLLAVATAALLAVAWRVLADFFYLQRLLCNSDFIHRSLLHR